MNTEIPMTFSAYSGEMRIDEEAQWVDRVRTLVRHGETAWDAARLLLVKNNLGNLTTLTILIRAFGLSIREGQDVMGMIYRNDSRPSDHVLDSSLLIKFSDERSWPTRTVFLEYPNNKETRQTLRISYYTPVSENEIIRIDWGDGNKEEYSWRELPLTHAYLTEGTYSFHCIMKGQENYEVNGELVIRPPKPENEIFKGFAAWSWQVYSSSKLT